MALITKKPWRTQPTGPVTVDWTNPITRGLLSVINGASCVESTNGRPLLPNGSAGIAQSRYGIALSSTSTTNQGWYSATAIPPATMSDGVTMLAFVEISSWVSYSHILCVPYGTGWTTPFGACGLQRNITNNALRVWGTNSAGGTVSAISTATVTAGNAYAIVVARRVGSTDFIINGAFETITNAVASGGSATDPWTNPNKQPINILNRSATSPGEGLSGRVAIAAFWTRALSVSEMRDVYTNPYQIFRPLELQLNSPPAPRIYYVAGPNATWATPTSTEIINGQLSGGGAATAAWNESAPLTTTTPFNFSQPASPLTTGTKYRAAAVQKAADSNVVSNVVVSDPFLAGAATLSNPEATEITGTSTKPKVDVAY